MGTCNLQPYALPALIYEAQPFMQHMQAGRQGLLRLNTGRSATNLLPSFQNSLSISTCRLAGEVFRAWKNVLADMRLDKAHVEQAALQAQLAQQHAENVRLRRDNERFVRLIDSGEWGRGRVSELMQAGKHLGPHLSNFGPRPGQPEALQGWAPWCRVGPFAHLPACWQLLGPADAKLHGCQGSAA